jgi:hypothetical protein
LAKRSTARITAGKDDGVEAVEVLGLMPDKFNRLRENVTNRVVGVVVAIRSGKNDDTKFHQAASRAHCNTAGIGAS